uniref:U2A'/phosphoprotein 32 family A C-terminal domain-containing protein n=1 Tax=Cucumis melo TaxID=3656 RepID=A0A9I9E0B4_CUCME
MPASDYSFLKLSQASSCLLDNNIMKQPNYRLYVIHKLKSVRVLDFKKVRNKERLEARNLFSSKEVEEEGKKESVKTLISGEVEKESKPAAIVNSQTLEEVASPSLLKRKMEEKIRVDDFILGRRDFKSELFHSSVRKKKTD